MSNIKLLYVWLRSLWLGEKTPILTSVIGWKIPYIDKTVGYMQNSKRFLEGVTGRFYVG